MTGDRVQPGQRRSRWFDLAVVVGGSVVAVAALLWSISSLSDLRAEQTWLKARGSRTTATVLKVNRVGGEPCGSVDVSYTTDEGQAVRVDGLELAPFGESLKRGSTFPLLYDPKDLTQVRPAAGHCGDRYGEGRRWLVATTAVVASVALAGWFVWRRRRPGEVTASGRGF